MAKAMTKAVINPKAQVEHTLVRQKPGWQGERATCSCGCWELITNEVVEADIEKRFRREHALHLEDVRAGII